MNAIATPSPRKRISSAIASALAAGGLTLLLLAAVYALRGIWPFGADNIAYVDTAQFYLPGYYNLWDALHGAGQTVNWYPGLIEGSLASWLDFTTPANWVFLFVARDHVLEALSLYLAVCLVLIAFLASLVLSIRFPSLSRLWNLLLALSYTFSGFVLQYYSNLFWLWPVALFPLLLWALERLLREGKYLPYALLYAYYLWLSVYYTYMVTLYILLFSFGYILFVLPRAQRGDRILRLGFSTAAAYGVTAYYWLGSSSSLAGTSRFQSNLDTGLMTGFTTWDIPNTRHTALMLLGMALAVALLLRALGRRRFALRGEQGRGPRFFLFLLGMLAIPMVFTNIDTAWHFGQYNFFPMRYGYVLPATLTAGAALCLQEERALPAGPALPNKKQLWLSRCAGVVCAAGLALLLPRLWPIFQEYGACFLTVLGRAGYWKYFCLYAGCGLLFLGLYLALFRLQSRRASSALIAAALLAQLASNAYGLLAPGDDHVYTNEYDPAYVDTADSLYAYFSGQNISPLERFKNVDNSLNAGYPAIAGVSALSSVSSSNSALRLGVFQELGYTVNYCRILDTGGTVFSDMLLGVRHILSAAAPDTSLYADTGVTVDGIHLGEARFPGYIGLTYADGALDSYLDLLTLPDRLNALYAAFTGREEPLASAPEKTLSAQGDGLKTYTLTLRLEEESFLYLAADGVLLNITAGGAPVAVPSYQNTANTVYPAAFNSNLLYLGRFDAGETAVSFLSASPLTEDSFTAVALDAAKLEAFYENAAYDPDTAVSTTEGSIFLTLTASGTNRRLFLPVTYSSRWQCTVNGSPAQPERVMGVLMSVPLQDGENEIVLTRSAGRLSLSWPMTISLACLILAAAWLIFSRARAGRKTLRPPAGIYAGASALFWLICGAMFAFIYLLPTVLLLCRGSIVRF